MFYGISRKKWVFLWVQVIVVFFQYPVLFWPMSMAAEFDNVFGWSLNQSMILIGVAFLPNVFFCVQFGIYLQYSAEYLLLVTLSIGTLSTYWQITSIMHGDYFGAIFSRLCFGVGAINSLNISLYLTNLHFISIGKTTFAFGLRGFFASMSEGFAFLILANLFNKSLIGEKNTYKGKSFEGQAWYTGICATLSLAIWVLYLAFIHKIPEELPPIRIKETVKMTTKQRMKYCFESFKAIQKKCFQKKEKLQKDKDESDIAEKLDNSSIKGRKPLLADEKLEDSQQNNSITNLYDDTPQSLSNMKSRKDTLKARSGSDQKDITNDSNRTNFPEDLRFKTITENFDQGKILTEEEGHENKEDKENQLALETQTDGEDDEIFDKLKDEEISIKTIKEIPLKGWLIQFIICTTSTVYLLVFALFPAILQNKYGFSVNEVGNIMFRTPMIEGIAKAVGVMFAIRYGKRGFLIMITSIVSTIILLIFSILPAGNHSMVQVLQTIQPIFIGFFFSILTNAQSLTTNTKTISVAQGLSMSFSNFSFSILPPIFSVITGATNGNYDNGMLFITFVQFVGTLTAIWLYLVDVEGNSSLDLRETLGSFGEGSKAQKDIENVQEEDSPNRKLVF